MGANKLFQDAYKVKDERKMEIKRSRENRSCGRRVGLFGETHCRCDCETERKRERRGIQREVVEF